MYIYTHARVKGCKWSEGAMKDRNKTYMEEIMSKTNMVTGTQIVAYFKPYTAVVISILH